jgi:hypothetical protein
MKNYLFTVTIHRGERGIPGHVLIKAKDQDAAWEIGCGELHDVYEEDNGKYWNYGDGETAATAKGIEEISQEEAETLSRLNVIHFLN